MSENPYTSPEHSGNAPKRKNSLNWVNILAVVVIVVIGFGLLFPYSRGGGDRSAALRAQCNNNLRQIAFALLTYELTYRALPPAYTVDSGGKPLHSWRTLILPFLGQTELYKKIDLSKPWDDPANAEACKTEVAVFHCSADETPRNHTTYLASVAAGGCFRLTEPRDRFRDHRWSFGNHHGD